MNNKPYYFIRAWNSIVGLKYSESIFKVLCQAQEENAPERAIYRGKETWVTADELVNKAVKLQLEQLVSLYKEEKNVQNHVHHDVDSGLERIPVRP
jgi:hypothetical protein